MRLEATIQPGWIQKWGPRGSRLEHDPSLFIELEVEAYSLEVRAFERLPSDDGNQLRITSRRAGVTADGARYERIEVAVLALGAIVEARVVIVIDLEDHWGIARCRAFRPTTLVLQRAAIESVFASLHAVDSGAPSLGRLLSPAPPLAASELSECGQAAGLEVCTTTTACVVRPRDRDELLSALQVHTAEAPRLRARRAMVEAGLVIDLRGLDRIIRDDANAETLTVESGCTWTQVVEHLRLQGRRPHVLVADLERSVGSTLALGGIGDGSHREGAALAQVVELTVIRNGALVRAVPGDEAFAAALGGAGTAVTIVDATLRTRRGPLAVVARTLEWASVADFASVAIDLARSTRCEVMRAWLVPSGGAVGVHALLGVDGPDEALVALGTFDAASASPVGPLPLVPRDLPVDEVRIFELALPLAEVAPRLFELVWDLVEGGVMAWLGAPATLAVVACDDLPRSPYHLGAAHALVLTLALRPTTGVRAQAALDAAANYVIAHGGRIAPRYG